MSDPKNEPFFRQEKLSKVQTINFYDNNAQEFFKTTINVEFEQQRNMLTQYLNKGDYILDFGCGSGRDTKAFLEDGFSVDATDGSAELVKIATKYTGIKVKQLLFSELSSQNIYNAIWACASILHLSKHDLLDIFYKLNIALKPNGYLYTSFKYGEFEGIRNGRFFSDFTESSFRTFISHQNFFNIIQTEITNDVRVGRETEKWLNVILQKK